MASVNNVSFTGLALTKNGNQYEKCKTGRNIGTVVGLFGGSLAMSLGGNAKMLFKAAKICDKNAKLTPYMFLISSALTVGSIIASTFAGRALGAIPDAIINNGRKAKADERALDKQA